MEERDRDREKQRERVGVGDRETKIETGVYQSPLNKEKGMILCQKSM